MDKNMEHEMETLGPFRGIQGFYKDSIAFFTMMETQMESKLNEHTEALGLLQGST